MQKTLLFKIAAIGGIVLTLMVVLSMIHDVIRERQGWRSAAYQDIAQSLAGNQQLLGPVLVIPYEETTTVASENPLTKKIEQQTLKNRKFLYVMPETVTVDGQVKIEERHRGIYKVPTFSTAATITGSITIPKAFPQENTNTKMLRKEAFLWVAVSDNRGIISRPVLTWNGEQLNFTPGSTDNFALKEVAGGGISAAIDLSTSQSTSYDFSYAMTVAGTQRLDWVPSAKDMSVTLTSNWPHPSFSGQFLPTERKVTESGFTANWQISHFASNAEDLLQACASGSCQSLGKNAFGVAFMTPVDSYQQTERAIKYGLLFISLTFISFFLFETLRSLPIHPIQYGLVGVALAIFFQLLISLSEHLAFAAAYSVASTACVALLGVYVSAVLKSAKRGAGFAAGLTALYATLYALLQSEDNALLLGSLLIFSVLSGIMILTRNVDWYKIGLPSVTNKSAQ
jgi:inner membrane protein